MPRKKVIDAPIETSSSDASKYVFFGVIALAVIGIFVSIFIGRADGDAIDVSGVITTSNTAAREAGGEGAAQQTVSTHRDLPNGGLVGKGDEGGVPPPPVEEVTSSTTASSTPPSEGEAEEGTSSDEVQAEEATETSDAPAE